MRHRLLYRLLKFLRRNCPVTKCRIKSLSCYFRRRWHVFKENLDGSLDGIPEEIYTDFVRIEYFNEFAQQVRESNASFLNDLIYRFWYFVYAQIGNQHVTKRCPSLLDRFTQLDGHIGCDKSAQCLKLLGQFRAGFLCKNLLASGKKIAAEHRFR